MEDLQKKNARLNISLASDSGYKNMWGIRCSPLQYQAICQILEQDRMPEWITLDWNNRETWPEEMRKVWIVSDRIKFEEEFIAYRDGDFYRDNTDLRIGEEMEVGLRWCYVVKPNKPE